jgi:hypothetical protein
VKHLRKLLNSRKQQQQANADYDAHDKKHGQQFNDDDMIDLVNERKMNPLSGPSFSTRKRKDAVKGTRSKGPKEKKDKTGPDYIDCPDGCKKRVKHTKQGLKQHKIYCKALCKAVATSST